MKKSTIKAVACGLFLAVSMSVSAWAVTTPNGTHISTAPDGKVVVKPAGSPPYCAHGCDIAEDCNGNKAHVPLRKGEKWTCNNKPGFCKGTCEVESTGLLDRK